MLFWSAVWKTVREGREKWSRWGCGTVLRKVEWQAKIAQRREMNLWLESPVVISECTYCRWRERYQGLSAGSISLSGFEPRTIQFLEKDELIICCGESLGSLCISVTSKIHLHRRCCYLKMLT